MSSRLRASRLCTSTRPAPGLLRPGALAACLCLLLTACGGGGGPAETPPGAAAPAAPAASASPVAPAVQVVLSGVAATGSAMVGATVRVIDARGVEVGRSAAVGSDGAFTVQLPAAALAPLVLEAAAPGGESQVSVLDRLQGSDVTVNVTPLTSLIAARLSPNGLPQGLVAQFEQAAGQAAPSLPSPAAILETKQDVLRIIEPVRAALGDATDPVSGRFAVGGTGHDKLLDSLSVTISPAGLSSTNIEVTVRTKRDDDTPMPAVSFSSTTPSNALPQVSSSLRRDDFGASGTSARVEALVAEINRCYALPVDGRVNSTTATPRTAALVKDGACRTMYFNADPGLFLDNGAVVGNGAGGGLFAADLLVFDGPVYEYTRAATAQRPEMVVFTVRWTNQRTQASDTMLVHARADEAGHLKLYGNQYAHPMSVRPVAMRQTHLRADSVHMDNLRTGYNFVVANELQDGLPRYDRVEVVAPVGLERSATRDVFVLRPMAGYTQLRMTGNFLATRSSTAVWMGGGWVDAAAATGTQTASDRTVAHPIELDGGGAVWVDDPQGRGWNDDRLERLSHKSAWTFRYFLRGNSSDTPDAVQSMTTVSRAPSIREVRAQPLASFTPATLAWLRAMAAEPSANMFWLNARPEGANAAWPTEPPAIHLAWEVPAGALAPTGVNGYGRTTTSYAIGWEQRTGFDRQLRVASTQREVAMDCVTASAELRPVLCHANGNADRYALKTMFSDFDLSASNARQVSFTHSHAAYRPQVRLTTANMTQQLLTAAP